jgi:aminoglycoside 3-N-acetyltransferase
MPDHSESVRSEDLRSALRASDLSGRPVGAHSSLASFGTLVGGADALVDAFMAEGCTPLVPTFSWERYAVEPPEDLQPRRNGWTYEQSSVHQPPLEVFHPGSGFIDGDMGAIPAAVLNRAGRERGGNPLVSFTAVGPLAPELVKQQTADDAFAPLEVLALSDGYVVLIGVDLRRMTLLHLAERHAGRVMPRRWAFNDDGQVTMVEVGGCSEGFRSLEPALASIKQDLMVGSSHWQVFRPDHALTAATAAIGQDPRITVCDDPSCLRCRDAILGGPLLQSN